MLIAFSLMLTSCMGDSFSKQKICENLYSSYTARADFIFSDGEKNTSGSADIVKSDVTTVTITSPDSFSGISIKGDSTGNADVFSFELSGIPAEVPKSIAGDVSLMFSLFSQEIPSKIESLGKDAFSISERTGENGNELIEVFFWENNMSYNISYDKYSGIPYSLDAGNDEISVSIILSDFRLTQNK